MDGASAAIENMTLPETNWSPGPGLRFIVCCTVCREGSRWERNKVIGQIVSKIERNIVMRFDYGGKQSGYVPLLLLSMSSTLTCTAPRNPRSARVNLRWSKIWRESVDDGRTALHRNRNVNQYPNRGIHDMPPFQETLA